MFSTFVWFEADRFGRWVTDAKLRRNMQRCLEHLGEEPASVLAQAESFWSLYWYKQWDAQSQAFAGLHLSAYLQEPGYWAAQRTKRKFTSIQYSAADYFQLALTEINTVLKGFNPDRGASLKTYASMAFLSVLKDILRQRHEADLCTAWTLLRRSSKKCLMEALKQAGLSATPIAQYRLAWLCFKTLYVPTSPTHPLSKPEPAIWQAIAALYNAERLHQLPASSSACDAETIERWLSHSAILLRSYLYPAIGSLNWQKPGQSSSELQDSLFEPAVESPLGQLITQEECQQRELRQAQVYSILEIALKHLDDASQTLLRLYYQDGLTQQQLIHQLQMSQPTISRRLTKAREALLAALIQWSQQELNNPVTPTLIKDISVVLEEWLGAYYRPDFSFKTANIRDGS